MFAHWYDKTRPLVSFFAVQGICVFSVCLGHGDEQERCKE